MRIKLIRSETPHFYDDELRKKYIGKKVSDSYANQHSISLDLDADPDY